MGGKRFSSRTSVRYAISIGRETLQANTGSYLERGETLEDLVATGFDAPLVCRVLQLVDDSEFQRRQTPPSVRIMTRAFGQDLRMPITNAWRPCAADHGPPVEVPLNPVRGDPPGAE